MQVINPLFIWILKETMCQQMQQQMDILISDMQDLEEKNSTLVDQRKYMEALLDEAQRERDMVSVKFYSYFI